MEEVSSAEVLQHPSVPHRSGQWKEQEAALPQQDSVPRPESGLDSPLLPQAPGSAVSALQSKVKALSERRAAGKEDKGPSAHEQGQQRKGPSKAPTGQQVASKPIGSDEEVDPQFQVHTYLTDNILQSDQEDLYEDPYKMGPLSSLALSRGLGEGASLENLSNGVGVQEEPNTKSWTPPKGFWKAARPETLLLRDNLQAGSEQALRADTQHQLWEAPIQRKATPGAQPLRRDLQRSDSLESHLWRAGRKELPLGGLWRADSWESVCSNSSSLSLAERVEMNRGILKQMLNRPESRSQSPLELRGKELPECNGRGLSTLNDSDWDSGISLQDSEHSHRAFVSCEELPLSPRHEQAKRLLERARMKARSHPLKADHSILPIQKEAPESSGAGLLRRGLAGRDGATASCGNLSDSSSGESSGGLRRRHGQSPTRVRFEDESAQDAEVRYLERLQQRRRAAERGQGLLVSKPHLSSYVNGGPSKSEGSSGRAERGRSPEGAPLWSRKTRRTHDGSHSNSESGSDKGQSAGRKCDSCGSVLQELDQSLLPRYCQLNEDMCPHTASAAPRPEFQTAHLEPLSSGDSRHRGLLRAEYPRDSADGVEAHRKYPESSEMKDDRPKLSLRRFLSAIGHSTVGRLSKGRSSSMEQLSVSPRHSAGSPSSSQKPCGQLKKAPSLQSLRLGSPFTQLRKASSVQSLQSPKRKADRSSAYMVGEPASFSPTHRGLQRALSVEDVGCPSGVRTVGRVAQAFPDGTLLLELSRPANGPFGFLISRGKGRPDSGVYVEEMGDSGTQKLYAGLLGVGDEILEVNGEKVAGLSLEEVTWLMTQHTTTSIRVLRHRRSPQ
ncbi:uncharacterized protein KIAA1614 homolog isoform X2 [Lepisosteus oculatus]|uniref:uncharacterized protein KIAA1614 homolog isoform X2 n=1 Tax=Lepisosteus oculatus TaxID=7918 RepID=UPI00073FF2D5|nr:PREDICTED: uncharacterized protein KIAA1614 homolog isoform X2 [Lepisosteus oculatus]